MPFNCARPDGINTLPDQRKRKPHAAQKETPAQGEEQGLRPEPSWGVITEGESGRSLWETLKLALSYGKD